LLEALDAFLLGAFEALLLEALEALSHWKLAGGSEV
jgi:hypothetical protein